MSSASLTEIEYPSSDGQPMAENTRQAEYITTIYANLGAQFRERPDVFVAMDNLWYPVEGQPEIRNAPDVYIVFGRPKGHRGSWMQWREGGIAPQVVFEILSPGNRFGAMLRKEQFYERYGVEEYYVYDPDDGTLEGRRRKHNRLVPIETMSGHVSPRLGIRFELDDLDLKLFGPDGRPFLSVIEIAARIDQEIDRADDERLRADEERLARLQAQQRADAEKQRADRLAAMLLELGVDPKNA